MEPPEGQFECPICHRWIQISEELDRLATQAYIDKYGLEKFEEDRPDLKRICMDCDKILNAKYN